MTPKMKQCKEFADLVFDCEADPEMKWLTMNWMADKFADRFIQQFMPNIIRCYDKLEGYTITNQFEYNDLDNHAWRVNYPDERTEWPSNKNKKPRAFVHTSQNRNVLFVITTNWMHGIEEQSEFNLMVYQYRHECYAKKHETLKQLIERGGSRYQDSRDKEYICGASGLDGRSNGALHRMSSIEMAFFDIEGLEYAQENPE